MADKELAAGLKQAQRAGAKQGLNFAFFPKGTGGKLIVGKAIDKKQLDEAKKAMGCAPLVGKCFAAEDGSMVFKAKGKAPSDAHLKAIQNIAKKDAGLAITAVAGVETEETAEATAGDGGGMLGGMAGAVGAAVAAAAGQPAAPTPGPAAPPAPAAKGNVAGLQTGLKKLGYDPGKIDGIMGPHTQAAIKKFQQDHGLAADGIAGPKTQAAMAVALKGGAAPAGGPSAAPVPSPAPGAAPSAPPGAPAAPAGDQPAPQAADVSIDDADQQADTAELQAEAAADKAQIMARLAALAGPLKQAVADKGPDVQRLQSLLATIKDNIGKQQLSQASQGLDMLEQLLDVPTIPPDATDDDSSAAADDQASADSQDQAQDDDTGSAEHGMGVDADDKLPDADDADDIGQQTEAAEEEADAADLDAKAAAEKAQIMERLQALMGPYQDAVAEGGPNAKRLQTLFATIKASIDSEQFTRAADGLDKFEAMLGESDDAESPDDAGSPEPTMEQDQGDDDQAPDIDLGPWKAAKQNGIDMAKALAGKVAATKHDLAGGVLAEINSIIGFVKKLPDTPAPHEIDKIVASIEGHQAITDAEGVPGHFAKVDIRKPLLNALKALKK
jgi:hypothetical protein